MAQAHVDSTQVQIMGPGLWGAFASKLGTLSGAWYAAPDPASRQAFVQQFMARYHHMPTPLADLTYDSAALVKALDQARPAGSPNGYSVQALTRPDGFGGVDGAFGFLENGRTRRDLAVFQILPGGGSRIVIPRRAGCAAVPIRQWPEIIYRQEIKDVPGSPFQIKATLPVTSPVKLYRTFSYGRGHGPCSLRARAGSRDQLRGLTAAVQAATVAPFDSTGRIACSAASNVR
ncbi:ABC transporter substrate-binding protein [Komagataeibacter rhaeticus]|nr:ABC transporter substrate-binding protein [Komagataeibacter rhaeticus]